MIKTYPVQYKMQIDIFREWVLEEFAEIFDSIPKEEELLSYYHFKEEYRSNPGSIRLTKNQYQDYLKLLMPQERPYLNQKAHFMGFLIEINT